MRTRSDESSESRMYIRGFVVVLVALIVAPAVSGAEIFVGVNGDDANAGTREKPVRTLEAARDKVRAMQPLRGGVEVVIASGTYRISKTFELDERDSGAGAIPVVWRAAEGAE